jgi:serine/threonine protein kinase
VEINKLCMGCMEFNGGKKVCPGCGYVAGSEPEEPWQLRPGTILNKKIILGKVIGFGGFGITYIAYDSKLDIKIAVKEYFPCELVSRVPGEIKVSVYTGKKKEEYLFGLERFLGEAQNLAKFISNPCIVGIHDYFKANNTAYIIMEYLNGISVKDYLGLSANKIEYNQALSIINHVIDALKDVHTENIIHRDVSPDNIMITYDKKVKLLDFGAAKYSVSEKSENLSVILKPGYSPIEQYRTRANLGAYTDVYSLAATFYKMITGITPPESVDRTVKDELIPPSVLKIAMPRHCERAIMKALAINPEDRFQTMHEFGEAMTSHTKTISNKDKALKGYYYYKNRKLKTVLKVLIPVLAASLIAIGVIFVPQYINQQNNSVYESYYKDTITANLKTIATQESGEILEEIGKQMKSDYPNITLDIEKINSEDYESFYMTRLNSGINTDLIEHMNFMSLEKSVMDNLLDLKEFTDSLDLDKYYCMDKLNFNNKAVPMGLDMAVVYYNKSLFNMFDLKMPDSDKWDFNALEDIADRLSYTIDGDDKYGLGIDISIYSYLMTLFNEDVYNKDSTKKLFNFINTCYHEKNCMIDNNLDVYKEFIDPEMKKLQCISVKQVI